MDDLTFHQSLEALATNAYNPDLSTNDSPSEPISQTISRWHALFSIPESTAVDRILEHRNNLTRIRVSDAHWEAVEAERVASGYDREAYEYELELQKKRALLPELMPESEGAFTVTYLVELAGPLESPEKVQRAAEGREVSLCCLDGAAKNALLRWAAEEGGGSEPTILVNPKSLR
ncbi:uncharacterized protein LTR77_002137 [Saxophila tyrrhenica]|uniref:Uncharacterized protein n=1 Tax=Saxophila tyrrhenica TaxID=1690608 RepID=A0AAV9PMA8_9PEZI|nr:hypothetical protein LTR77_002137 [Saxophila tyrrhenica]